MDILKTISKRISVFLLLFAVFAFSSCGKLGQNGELRFNNETKVCSANIGLGFSQPIIVHSKLTILVTVPKNDWAQSNGDPADIQTIKSENGRFKVVKSGNPFTIQATEAGADNITVITKDGKEDSVTISIQEPKQAQFLPFIPFIDNSYFLSLSLTNRDIIAQTGTNKLALTAIFKNGAGKLLAGDLGEDFFSIEDDNLVSFEKSDIDSQTIIITAKKQGHAIIKAKFDGKILAQYEFDIQDTPKPASIGLLNKATETNDYQLTYNTSDLFIPILLDKNNNVLIMKDSMPVTIEIANPDIVEKVEQSDEQLNYPVFKLQGKKVGETDVTISWYNINSTIHVKVIKPKEATHDSNQ